MTALPILVPQSREEIGEPGAGELHCITQDVKELAPAEALARCDDTPVDVIVSRRCPPECGGHPICAPCLERARSTGLVA